MIPLTHLRGVPIAFALLSLLGCRRHKEPFEKVPLQRGEVEFAKGPETANLTVERIRFWSDQMDEPRYFLALAPKTPAHPSEVFILNHGWFDRPEYLLKYLKVDQVYDGMLQRGEVRHAVVVIPDVRFKSFYGWRSERYPFPPYLTLLAEEVAGLVSRHYGIPFGRERWGIGGFSFGGYISLDVGRRYPGRFGSVSVISGFYDQNWSFWPSDSPESRPLDSEGRDAQTVVASGPTPRLFLACGTNDRFIGTMQRLHQTLLSLNIRHEWSTGPGGHTWEYWSSVLPQTIGFHLGAGRNGDSR
ncbi:MAG TPA: alpha/beta hydrolase-fold protein [Bryobacteraceae bacterium]|nr:alpha/beta hydrolase-fold protein [Bryobacteraceae bacterium]